MENTCVFSYVKTMAFWVMVTPACSFTADSWVTLSFAEQSVLFAQSLAASRMVFLIKTSLFPAGRAGGPPWARPEKGEGGKRGDDLIVQSPHRLCPPNYPPIGASSVTAQKALLIQRDHHTGMRKAQKKMLAGFCILTKFKQ